MSNIIVTLCVEAEASIYLFGFFTTLIIIQLSKHSTQRYLSLHIKNLVGVCLLSVVGTCVMKLALVILS